MKIYELIPVDSRKSFYGKAKVIIDDQGTETLYSYDTPVIARSASGELKRLYDGFTQTPGRHITAFCGLSKAQFLALKVER